jgi:biopolymer transport protein ExbD
MAELDTSSSGGGGRHKGKVRSKKMSTRVDFTPMVDLAFLLISFFMLTTSLSKPVAMQLAMPKKEKDEKKQDDVKASQVLNIILGKDNIVWYYEGLDPATLTQTDYTPQGIRDIIYAKQRKVDAMMPKKGQTICLIKMSENANYKNMVDILDEMDITKNEIFAIQDLNPNEIKIVNDKEALITSPSPTAAP